MSAVLADALPTNRMYYHLLYHNFSDLSSVLKYVEVRPLTLNSWNTMLQLTGPLFSCQSLTDERSMLHLIYAAIYLH